MSFSNAFRRIFHPAHPAVTAWKSFLRHKTLTLATLALISLMFFIFNVVFSIHTLTSQIFSFLNEKVDMSLEFTESATPNDMQLVAEDLEKLPFIKEVRLVSREDALETVDRELIPGYRAFVERYQLSNPFPSSLHIVTPRVEDHEKALSYLRESSYSTLFVGQLTEDISEDSEGAMLSKSAASELKKFANLINSVLFVVLLLFMVAGIAILANALYLSVKSKRHEIFIMHVVGATEKHIALPFLFEGIYYGLFSSLIGIVCFHFVSLIGGSEIFPYLFSFGRIFAQIVFAVFFSGLLSLALVHFALRGKVRL